MYVSTYVTLVEALRTCEEMNESNRIELIGARGLRLSEVYYFILFIFGVWWSSYSIVSSAGD